MNRQKINTDQVITNTKKVLYDLRDIDHAAMSKEERTFFREELEELALSILDKIKD